MTMSRKRHHTTTTTLLLLIFIYIPAVAAARLDAFCAIPIYSFHQTHLKLN